MREMNFFRSYLKEKPKSSPLRLLVLVGILLILAGGAYFTVDLLLKQNAVEQELVELDTQLADSARLTAVARIDEKTKQIEVLDALEASLHGAQLEFDRINVVSDDFMNLLNAQVPSGVMLSNLTINGPSITLKGAGESTHVIAQFAYNLRRTGRFDRIINLESIQNQDGNFEFALNMLLYVGEAVDEGQ